MSAKVHERVGSPYCPGWSVARSRFGRLLPESDSRATCAYPAGASRATWLNAGDCTCGHRSRSGGGTGALRPGGRGRRRGAWLAITLDRGEFLLVPDDHPENLQAVERAAGVLGARGRKLDDPFGGFDPRWRWSLPSGQQLVASVGPAGAHGYRDLLRDAEAVTLGAALVNVASLRDLIRLADASPRERERAFTPALWTTLDQTRLAERKAA